MTKYENNSTIYSSIRERSEKMEQITLKAARITAGFTLREVGKKLNRSFQTIAKYEKDSTKIPIDLLQDLTTLYNVSMDIIFLGRSTKKSVQKRKE